MKKLVTVIVPTIGRPKYIKSAVNSVLMQDYEEIEVLISDNYPEISTRTVLGMMHDPRIRFIERDRRYESSEHMNMCINEARGEYVMILSDDDLICPSYVSSMVGLFSENTDVMVCLGQQKVLNENDANLEGGEGEERRYLFDGTAFTLDHFRGKPMPIYTYFSLFAKKADVLAVGGFRAYPDGSNADNYLFYSLALRGKVGVSSSLMGYRVYMASSGLSTSFEKLYLATVAYDKDMSCLVWGAISMPILIKTQLRLLIKISSVRMMKYRLHKIYRAKIGLGIAALNLAKVIFVFLPRNIFYGVWKDNKPRQVI